MDEFSFKAVKTSGQSKTSSYCFVFGVNQENEEQVELMTVLRNPSGGNLLRQSCI